MMKFASTYLPPSRTTVNAPDKNQHDSAKIGLLGQLLKMIGQHTNRMRLAAQVSRERKQLQLLSDHQLRDMGISRAMAQREASLGVSDIPDFRLSEYGILNCGCTKKPQPFR